MEFVELNLSINVTYGTMTADQYKKTEHFFNSLIHAEKVDNAKLIDFLSLDKRPFAVRSIGSKATDENVKTVTIDLIC